MLKPLLYYKSLLRIILVFIIDKVILNKSASILTYHSVGDNKEFFTVSPLEFRWQMEYLYKNNYKVISLSTLITLLESGRVIPKKTVVLTFDDGYEDNYHNAFPILKKYYFPATIFLTTGWVGDKNHKTKRGYRIPMIDWNHAILMHQSGLIDFEPHTVSHPSLATIDIEKAKKEIDESRLVIENSLGKKCDSFCYPHGEYDVNTESFVRNSFKSSVSVKKGFIEKRDSPFVLKRNAIDSLTTKFSFKLKI